MKPSELSAATLHEEVLRRYGNSAAFVNRVNATLDFHEITQTDLARVAGFGRVTINRWLRGKVEPPITSMMVVDEALERLVEAEL